MTLYKCGHIGKPVFMGNNPLSFAAYCVWKDKYGFDGDESLCWECFCKKMHEEGK